MRIAWFIALGLAACGDNSSDRPDAPGPGPDGPPDSPPGERCTPPPSELPAEGPHRDPAALPLTGCVEGGLRNLPGRWFARSATDNFRYEYPRFEGSCETGFRRVGAIEDHDASDGATVHQWSDGTRYFFRDYYEFANGPTTDRWIHAMATCVRSDGTIAVAGIEGFDGDETAYEMTGERFEARTGSPELTLLGEIGMQNNRPIIGEGIAVEGRYAYIVGVFGLEIIDITNPSAPVHTGHVTGFFSDVRVLRRDGKTAAYLSSSLGARTRVVDVTDPAAPVVAGQLSDSSSAAFLRQSAGSAELFLATLGDTVPRYDVTNPLAPVRLDQATVPDANDGVQDLTVDGTRIYANAAAGGLVALDVSAGLPGAVESGRSPATFSRASAVGTAGGRRVVLHGEEGMTPDGGAALRILDGDPASPTYMQQLGRYQSRDQVGLRSFAMVGSRAYLAYYQDGVRVLDLSNPAAPQEIAHYNTLDLETAYGLRFQGAFAVHVAGDYLYVADSARGLMIFSVPQ